MGRWRTKIRKKLRKRWWWDKDQHSNEAEPLDGKGSQIQTYIEAKQKYLEETVFLLVLQVANG